ncbi:unnamed protein product [Cuscuta campestris]|uniref:Uncharacterized protein n=1 Tax=Cuscuta campestris TaxID=132261 RepID=A0A484L7R5_9ASTE|nr:unnamed protein product [Cuscuta campestris]
MKYRVRVLQREVEEMICIREEESRMLERETLLLAIREAEWRKEREALKDQLNMLRNMFFCDQRPRFFSSSSNSNNNNGEEVCLDEMMKIIRDDEGVVDNKWKRLYFAIKVELDRLILTTNNDNSTRSNRDMEEEVRGKEERIRDLESRIAFLEQQELRRQRELDILRQSLRIMFYYNNHNNNQALSFHLN